MNAQSGAFTCRPTIQQQPSPYQLQQNFIVPLLCVEEDGDLFVFESTFLLEHPWRLGQKDATLSGDYNPLKRPTGKAGIAVLFRTSARKAVMLHFAFGVCR